MAGRGGRNKGAHGEQKNVGSYMCILPKQRKKKKEKEKEKRTKKGKRTKRKRKKEKK
jgi:hypothetical protein